MRTSNRSTRLLFISTLVLIAFTAGALSYLRTHQRLGQPGVRTKASSDPRRLQVDLPERVLNCTSEPIETEQLVLDFLPKDTSFGQRRYTAPDGFNAILNVVLMGSDRTSIHKPQFCLAGTGWDIDYSLSKETTVPIQRPFPYELPVMKLIANKHFVQDGKTTLARGVYVYWFVCEDGYTSSHNKRMWSMAEHMVKTGVLQRWAYVTCFSVCAPGGEDATFERMKQFIASAVPEFQLTPAPKTTLAGDSAR